MENKFPPTDWVKELPTIGSQCPKCTTGYLTDSSFTAKNGKSYEKVSCPACKYAWIKSQFKEGSKRATPMREGDQGAQILQGIDDIKAGIKVINDNIKTIFSGKKEEPEYKIEGLQDGDGGTGQSASTD